MSNQWWLIIGCASIVIFFTLLVLSLILMNLQDRIDFSDDRLNFVNPAKRPKRRT